MAYISTQSIKHGYVDSLTNPAQRAESVKIPHTGITANLDVYGQQHKYKKYLYEYTLKPERKKSSKTQKLKNVQKYAKISDMPFNQRSLIHREAWFPPCFVRQNQPKKIFFVWQFQTTSKQKYSNLRPLLSKTFPQGFRLSKNIGHPTLGSGGKKTFKRYLKSEHTDKQMDRQTDISTYRKHRPRRPML